MSCAGFTSGEQVTPLQALANQIAVNCNLLSSGPKTAAAADTQKPRQTRRSRANSSGGLLATAAAAAARSGNSGNSGGSSGGRASEKQIERQKETESGRKRENHLFFLSCGRPPTGSEKLNTGWRLKY